MGSPSCCRYADCGSKASSVRDEIYARCRVGSCHHEVNGARGPLNGPGWVQGVLSRLHGSG